MANGKSSKFITLSMPKTGWREPSRAKDDLLKLPKGHLLTPTEEVGEFVPAEAAFGTGPVTAATMVGEVTAPAVDETSRAEHVVAVDDESFGGVPSRMGSEAAISTLDGIFEQAEEYDSDAEDGPGAAEQMIDAFSIVAEEDLMFVPDAGDELDDDELLAGEERDTEDDYRQTPSASCPHTSPSTGPRPVPASVHRAKALREGTESIQPHPIDATKVIVTYRYTDPAGGVYVQETEMPEVVRAPANASSNAGSIIVPDVEASKVPRTKKGSPWTPVPGTSRYEWTRGDGDQQETWRVVIFFRRLHRDTHAYQDIYVNTNMLNNVDPNDKRFRTSYNKWILQFARRRDATYTQKVARVHWSVAERHALYTTINTFCAKYGIHSFGFSDDCMLSTKQLQLMADAVNAAPNPLRSAPRGVDAVRGQIISAHDKAQPKNKAIFDLMARAVALRARIAGGEVIPRAERKPKLAIPLCEFPVDPPVAASDSLTPGGRKRKRAAAVEASDGEPPSSELSSPPGSEVGGNDGVSEDTWMTTDEEIQPGESDEGNWSDTSEEMLSGEDEHGEWVEVEEIASSYPRRKPALLIVRLVWM
ncbi:hypothetical protein BU25DRAFT_463590 [Macroventuria anomochaeta]|uniref:Uncharacterized protein n=1 Tax=Macroventuria anomochaeta TaxID=301207 RepID=A0ACB6RJR8_9PLEO|nr:uncharacterized protein BU25DRAFT_463590 [Macroventuria anomochaeta]KAF2621640.1 hypothetical protein BU25DRAFT_463590 [Macroventuria anomochaeta]